MTTLFSLLRQVCGLSQREAADFLDARLDTVKSWSAGRNPTPPGVIDALADLANRIDAAADGAVGKIVEQIARHGDGGVVELGVAADDHEAQSLGWPCGSAHGMVIGLTASRALAEGHTVDVVPRGSTVATAAAIEIHEKS